MERNLQSVKEMNGIGENSRLTRRLLAATLGPEVCTTQLGRVDQTEDSEEGSVWMKGKDSKMPINLAHRWGMVLAGGDGVRLRPLTRFICGDERPKQFCPLLGDSSLLQQARQRAERSICPNQILYSVVKAHRDYYIHDLADRIPQTVVQPRNRGTGPAIVAPLLRILQMDPNAIIAVLPSDHYYSAESVFTYSFERAFAIAEGRKGSVVLLGARPRTPEVEYGWIALGEPVASHRTDVFRVSQFHEKPPLQVAERLLREGCLWNTFVMVGHIKAFLDLALAAVPGLLQALRPVRDLVGSDGETRIAESVYDKIATTDFCRHVLSPKARSLVTLQLGAVEWNDLGHPDRVVSTLLGSDLKLPGWVRRWHCETQSGPPADRSRWMASA